MKILKQTILITFSMLMFFSSCKKEMKKDTEDVEIKTFQKKVPFNSKPRPIQSSERSKYKDNLDVAKGESYFNLKGKYIKVKIAVHAEGFKYVFAKNISTTKENILFVGITDGTPRITRGKPQNFILEQDILFDNIEGTALNIKDTDSIRIVVVNDNSFKTIKKYDIDEYFKGMTYDSIKKAYEIKLIPPPGEAGGGIIIKGP
jgi:hypothetical protein